MVKTNSKATMTTIFSAELEKHLSTCTSFVAFDPSKAALGSAVFRRATVESQWMCSESFCLPKGWDELMCLAHMRFVARRHDVTHVVIEDQFVGNNPQAAMSVVESRMQVQVVARLLKLDVASCLASTWQRRLLYRDGERFPARTKGSTKQTHVPPRDVLKARSIELALQYSPKKTMLDDEADAICIGLFSTQMRTMTAQKDNENG